MGTNTLLEEGKDGIKEEGEGRIIPGELIGEQVDYLFTEGLCHFEGRIKFQDGKGKTFDLPRGFLYITGKGNAFLCIKEPLRPSEVTYLRIIAEIPNFTFSVLDEAQVIPLVSEPWFSLGLIEIHPQGYSRYNDQLSRDTLEPNFDCGIFGEMDLILTQETRFLLEKILNSSEISKFMELLRNFAFVLLKRIGRSNKPEDIAILSKILERFISNCE